MPEANTSEAERAKPDRPVPLSVQWHITTRCGNRCKHCYVFDSSTFEDERQHTLSLDDLLRVVARLEEFENAYNAKFNPFVISGGDPLLREDWAELVTELRQRERTVHFMANPETLTEVSVAKLAELGVRRVQMSLDGLEKTHDHFRSKGSFQRTVAKLALLREHGIRGQIMSTLYPANAAELIPLVRYVATQTKAYSFTFDLGCFVGNAAELRKDFSSEDLRAVLVAYLAEKACLRDEGRDLVVGEKCHLLKLARFENGTYYPSSTQHAACISGCSAGWGGLVLLSDGSAMACRRMPLKVGKMPEQSYEEIFLGHELLKKLRRPGYFQGCGQCDFYMVCRGCPANGYSLTGDPFARNPLCFRDSVRRKTDAASRIRPGPPLSTTYAEEWSLVLSCAKWRERVAAEMESGAFSSAYLDLSSDRNERLRFLADPRTYLADQGDGLDDEQMALLVARFAEGGHGDDREFAEDPLAEHAFSRMLDRLL